MWRPGPFQAVVAIAVLLAVAYANSWSVPFVFDDYHHIQGNPRIESLTTSFLGTSRPLAYVTFACNHALHGLDVAGYHLVNLVIHGAAAWLLYAIVARTLQLPGLAERYGQHAPALGLATALLWGLHPLQTQSVTYIYQRQESLMGLLFLAALYCFVRGERASESAARNRWLTMAVVSSALGMATKEVMAVAPLMVLWYDRVFLTDNWRALVHQRGKWHLALWGTTLIVPALIVLHWDQYPSAGLGVVRGVSVWQYAASQPRAILRYLQLAFWPSGQCLDYGWQPPQGWTDVAMGPALLVVALCALTAWATWRRPRWGFLGGWFFVILAPTSSIVPIIDLIYEHRVYLPLAAVATAVVVGAYRLLWITKPRLKVAMLSIFLLVLASEGWLTYRRNHDYRTRLALWLDVIAKRPYAETARARGIVGLIYKEQGATEAGLALMRESVALDATRWPLHMAIAGSLLDLGRPEEAAAHLRALPDDDNAAETREALLGTLLAGGQFRLQQNDPAAAQKLLLEARSLAPRRVDVRLSLGLAFAAAQQGPEAVEELQQAAILAPDNADVHAALGMQLRNQDQTTAAIQHLQKALRLRPRWPEVMQALQELQSEPTTNNVP